MRVNWKTQKPLGSDSEKAETDTREKVPNREMCYFASVARIKVNGRTTEYRLGIEIEDKGSGIGINDCCSEESKLANARVQNDTC